MSLRERVLMILFCWVILIGGTNYLLGRAKSNFTLWKSTSSSLDVQNEIFAMKPADDAEVNELQKLFSKDKTYSASKLVEKVDSLARGIGLVFSTNGNPKTQESPNGDVHTLYGSIKNKAIKDLVAFEGLLRLEHPYIRIESLDLQAKGSNPELINASFSIQSFELKTIF